MHEYGVCEGVLDAVRARARESTDLRAACPRCASTDVELSGGDEMTLESVTYVPEPGAGDAI